MVIIQASTMNEMKLEEELRPYMINGFRIGNAIVFSSEEPIQTISAYLSEYDDAKFNYLLFDVSNLSSETFKAFMHPKGYRHAEVLASEVKKFYTATEPAPQIDDLSKLSDKEKETLMNNLLDKISKGGIQALSPEEKKNLDSLNG